MHAKLLLFVVEIQMSNRLDASGVGNGDQPMTLPVLLLTTLQPAAAIATAAEMTASAEPAGMMFFATSQVTSGGTMARTMPPS
jgi:hypothetical protein